MPPEKSLETIVEKIPQKLPRRLGRGLDALLGEKTAAIAPHEQPASADAAAAPEGALREIAIASIRPNPFQPRKDFSPEQLAELRESIQTTGLLQPITVRALSGGAGYELVAGERRLRAATQLGWEKIPAMVRELNDRAMLTLALVENLQRSDLNPIDEAEGYERLTDEFGLTQQQIAQLVGKDRSTIANLLRVLALPAPVRTMLQAGQITLGHARPLLALDDAAAITRLARQAADDGLSVREIENRVRRDVPAATRSKRGRPRKVDHGPAQLQDIENRVRRRLQTDVAVRLKTGEAGELRVHFYSFDDLERVLASMGIAE